jgi:hypothetical protein
MSPAASYEPTPVLRAERGGLAPTASPSTRMHPAEIALTLSADVLRLPYTANTRLVLAEIVSLHAATGCCDASNPHFMARLTLKHDVVNEAIQRLHEEGLIVKLVDKGAGFYRTLTPVPAAIAAKAAVNAYPEKPTSYSKKPTSHPSRKSRLGQSEIPTTPSRENPLPLVGNPDTNTPSNIPVNFHQSSTTTPFGRGDAPQGPEVELEAPAEELAAVEVLEAELPPEPAPKKKAAAKKKPPERPARLSRPDIAFADSELADFAHFEAALAGTDYELADLRYYHEKIKNWRQKGEPPLRKDWLATSKQFFLNDVRENCLKLAAGVQRYDATGHAESVGSGAGATGYRSSRYDA